MTQMLKGCPFCGNDEPVMEKVSALSRLCAVFCNACEISGERMSTPEAAVEAWNTRASSIPEPEAASPKANDDGSLTLDNASVQRLMDYGLLHCVDDGWHVGEWPQSNARSPEAASSDEDAARADMHEIVQEDLTALNEFIQEHASVRELAVRGAFRRIEAIATRLSAEPEAVTLRALEAAWREGWATCKACLTEDASFELTADVEEDAWRDSDARAVLAKAGGWQ